MYRIDPTLSETAPWAGGVTTNLAVVLFQLNDGSSLQPGTTYEVGLEKTDGADVDRNDVYTFTTRSLPSETLPSPTTTISPGDNIQTAIDGANSDAGGGQIYVLFERGDHGDVSSIDWPSNLSGDSDSSPTIIAGEDRFSTFFETSTNDAMLFLDNDLTNVVFQDFTHFGVGTDGSVPLGSNSALCYSPGSADLNNVTFRRITATGLRQGIYSRGPVDSIANSSGVMGYDLTLIGTLVWNETNLRTASYGWDHYGISCAGEGHEFFNCYLELFGDGFSPVTGASGEPSYRDRNQFFYWSHMDRMFDDGCEFDQGEGWFGFYGNIMTNCTNFFSCDPLHGGPAYIFKNYCANILEVRMFKLNSDSAGLFVANNTLMLAEQINRSNSGDDNIAQYYQPNNATISDWVLGNNVFIRPNSTPTDYNIWYENTLGTREFFNNAYFPDVGFQIDGVDETSLANAQSNAPAADGFHYYPALQMFDGSVVSVAQPLATTFTFGADAFVGFEDELTPADFAANDSSIQNAGREIPGITDGYSGAAPDMGANISGQTQPTVGDTHNTVPRYAEDMQPGDVRQLSGSFAPVSGAVAMEDVTPTAWVNEASGGPGRTFFGIISAYSGGAGVVVATLSDGRFVVHGGGHQDCGNNGFYIYDPSTDQRLPIGWEDGVDISDNNIVTLGSPVEAESDGRATSVHTYGGVAYAPDRNLYYRAGGSPFSFGGGLVPDFWEYDPTQSQGSRWNQLTDVPGNSGDGMSLSYDETEGKLIAIDPGAGAWIFDIDDGASGTWSSEAGLTLFENFDTNGGYDSSRNIVLVDMNNGNTQAITFNLSTDTVTAESTITWTGSTTVADQRSARMYDPTRDLWWFFGGTSSGNYDTIAYCTGADLASGGNVAVTEIALSANMASTGFEEGIIGTFNRFMLAHENGFFLTAHRTDEAPWIARLPTLN